MDKIRLVVTQEKFDKNFSIDDWFNFTELSNKEMYNKMLLFVADKEGNPITQDEARAMFKKIPKKEWAEYVGLFISAVNNAFVNPTSGSD